MTKGIIIPILEKYEELLICNLHILHLFSFKTPILLDKKIRKKCKINSRNFTYDGLTFSSSFWLLEEVKDEI
jgi:hypothetical protein